jgi:peptide/nickel transport system permease protein
MTVESRPAVKARERLVAPVARSGEIPESTVESGWEKAQWRAGRGSPAGFANPLKSFNARRSTAQGVFVCPGTDGRRSGSDSEGIVVCRLVRIGTSGGHGNRSQMARSIATRLIYPVLVVLAAMSVVFVLLQLSGDPADALVPPGSDPADVAALRDKFGLDQSLPRQYLEYMQHAARGDFGVSWRTGQPAMELVLQRLGATMLLAGAAFALALVVAIPRGVLAGSGRSRPAGWLASGIGVLGQALPAFWLGTLLILLFSVRLGWVPSSGRDGWRSLILPAIALAAFPAATLMRIVRVSVADVTGADYVRTANAKGLPGWAVLWRHVARNAMLPAIAYAGVVGGFLVAGAVAVEAVFAWPGIGRLALQSVASRDLPVIQAFVAVVAVLIVLSNLIADLIAMMADPRLRAEARA